MLRGLERREILGPHDVDRIAVRVTALDIVVDTEAPMREFIVLSRSHGVSCYDATYLELAIRRGIPLATRDDGLARAARKSGVLLK